MFQNGTHKHIKFKRTILLSGYVQNGTHKHIKFKRTIF